MARLKVRLDSRLFDALRAAALCAGGDERRLRAMLTEVVSGDPVFESERELICSDLGRWFEVGAMAARPDFWPRQGALRSRLERHAGRAVAALAPYLPAPARGPERALTVHLIPGFTQCYGPREGVQLFGLRAGAGAEEALLFLVHVYYHEVSSLFYTETSRRAAAGPTTAEMFRHWLLLLIQNEGLANYVVLERMLGLRARGGEFSYFTYAELVRREGPTARAMEVCRGALSRINDADYSRALSGRVVDLLKDPRLPVVNLVGIHISEAVAAAFGERRLFSVADREPQEFFRMYAETGDPLCELLFGPGREAAPLFGLGRRGAPAGALG